MAWLSKKRVVELTAIAQSELNGLQNGTAKDNIDSKYRHQFGTPSNATASNLIYYVESNSQLKLYEYANSAWINFE